MHRFIWVAFLALSPSAAAAADEAIAKPIAALKAVDREGKNNDTVGLAWSGLVSQGAPALIPTLEAVDDANPTAANWLLTAAGAIAEGETKANRKLPLAKLTDFLKNTKYAASARVLVFGMFPEADRTAMLPTFLNDPSADLRLAAVAAEFEKAKTKADLERVLGFAREPDQVEAIAKKLETDHKVKVNLAEQFAFVTHWNIIGPFASERGKALTLKHRPEESVDFAEKLKGKADAEVKWKSVVTRDKLGAVDFNKEIGKLYDVAGYAAAKIYAEKETPAEIRVTSPNALQVFLNGKKLFEREEYHHGENMDYHVGKGVLKAGTNVLLVKICQNNQKEQWAQQWRFSARVSDSTGAPIPGVTQTIQYGDVLHNIKLGSVPAEEEKK
jgi:hypothetical protein